MLGRLRSAGYRLAGEPEDADVVVVNTCAFIRSAEEEAVQALLEAAELKREGRVKAVMASGCLVSRYGEAALKRSIPELDLASSAAPEHWFGPSVAGKLAALGSGKLRTAGPDSGTPRILLSGRGSAYLKLAEGCSRKCTFCLIPRLRGPLRSRPAEAVLHEAESLARRGIQELVLVAQDISQYGLDRPGGARLPELLDRLARIPAVRWLRLMYVNPDGVTDALLRRLHGEKKICKYLDMPVQHAEAGILRRMGRPGDGEKFLELIRRVRRSVPGIALRTTLLSGFPGETEAQHQRLLAFIRQAQFDRLGVFSYSPEEGTVSAGFSGRLSPRLLARRKRDLMREQAGISRIRLAKRVGTTVECLVEEPSGSRHVLARSGGEAPEVDGGIVLLGKAEAGDWVRARLTGSTDHDLSGEILGPAENPGKGKSRTGGMP